MEINGVNCVKYKLHEALILRGTTGGEYYFFKLTEIKELSHSFQQEIAPAPGSGQSLDRGAAMCMQAVKSRVTKIWGGNEFLDSIVLFCKMSYCKKNHVNSWNRKMQYHNHRIALKFNWHLGSIATDRFAKFQSDW